MTPDEVQSIKEMLMSPDIEMVELGIAVCLSTVGIINSSDTPMVIGLLGELTDGRLKQVIDQSTDPLLTEMLVELKRLHNDAIHQTITFVGEFTSDPQRVAPEQLPDPGSLFIYNGILYLVNTDRALISMQR